MNARIKISLNSSSACTSARTLSRAISTTSPSCLARIRAIARRPERGVSSPVNCPGPKILISVSWPNDGRPACARARGVHRMQDNPHLIENTSIGLVRWRDRVPCVVERFSRNPLVPMFLSLLSWTAQSQSAEPVRMTRSWQFAKQDSSQEKCL
jgi:hypothetical protein